MRKDISAVTFDLDGTLYPNYRFYIRLVPFVLRELRLLIAMGKARDILREENPEGSFYDLQAEVMAKILKKDPGVVKEKTERLIYRGWEPLFKRIRLFSHVKETLQALRDSGFKLGLLSDFPPERKAEYLGIAGCWDTIFSSEITNHLKPDPAPFLELSKRLLVPPDRILYVGNSVSYDIIGAKGAGMKTALVTSRFGNRRRNTGEADFVFTDYRQLRSYVLG
ncbi:HAD family hydrolase [Breznakiella homolactica]|uniref:HAD family hydrolase n=1 Tax=Breznakiella homolactica TaxID=2798577 RepID=A0A7T7XME6_9SPIR|nr:HAD family hydrolase [Breznakiella homolactica]QQO09029.1 HAD family hydrolase [Breznakiella homolactica]